MRLGFGSGRGSYQGRYHSNEKPQRTPGYTIIIVNRNAGKLLLDCLDSVFKFTSNFELILVDNGSTDGSEVMATDLHPEVTLLNNPSNAGFAQANNLAIRRAKGNWIVLLNADTIVTKDWLKKLIQSSVNNSQCGIVTPKLLRPDRRTLDSTGHSFDFKTAKAWDRGSGELDEGQYDREERILSCCFACAAIRRQVFENIGLLDERMIFLFEDVDFCIRADIAGWKVVYCPDAVVFHVRGGVRPGTSWNRLQRAIPYSLRIILKSYSLTSAVTLGAAVVRSNVASMLAGIKNRDAPYFLGYLRSPIWNILNLPIAERRLIQSKRRVSDSALVNLSKESN